MKLFTKSIPAPRTPDYDKISQLEDELNMVNAENYERKYDEMLIEEFKKHYGNDLHNYFEVLADGRFAHKHKGYARKPEPLTPEMRTAHHKYRELIKELNLSSSRDAMYRQYEDRYEEDDYDY